MKMLITVFTLFLLSCSSTWAEETPQMKEYLSSCSNMELKRFDNPNPITPADKSRAKELNEINLNKIADFNKRREALEMEPCPVPGDIKRQQAFAAQCQAPEGTTCSEGEVWNCDLNKCLIESDHLRVSKAARRCNGYGPEQKEKCLEEVKTFDDDKSVNTSSKKATKTQGLGTLAATASTVYQAYYAFLAGKEAFSMPACFAAPMGLAAGVASFMGQQNLKKQTKQEHSALAEQYKKFEELKGKQGVSYEIQVMALEYYVRALESSKRISDAHAKQYSSDMMFYTATGIVGAAEAIIYAPCPVPCNPAGAACGKKSAIGAGVGLGFATILKSQASKASKEYGKRAEKVKGVLQKYKELFGNRGGIEAMSGLKGKSISPISNVNAPTNVKAGEVENLTGDLSGAKHDRPGHCADKSGKLDPGCDKCAKDPRSCKTFPRFSGLNSQLQGFGRNAGIDKIMNQGDDILSGKLTSGSLKQSAIDSTNSKLNGARKALLGHFEKKKMNIPDELKKFDPVAAALSYTKKNMNNLNGTSSGNPWDVGGLDGSNQIESLIKDENLKKDLAAAKGTQAPVVSLQPSRLNFKSNLGLDDLDLGKDKENKANSEALEELVTAEEAGLKEGEEYDYEVGEGIVKHSHVSLFKIISNRYNIMRINKRISRK